MRHSVMATLVWCLNHLLVYTNTELVRVCGEEIGTYKGHISYDIL